MENKKVVITGGAGFIGSHLARRLVMRNHCTVIDDLSTGRIQNLADDIAEHRLEFVQGSILDLELLQGLFKDADYVFHEAAMVSVPRSMEKPLACTMVNVIGTLNVLLAARDNRVAKVACASSSSVYGDTPDLPRREHAKPSPLSPYAVSKLAGELYCRVFSSAFGVATVCLRYFNVYGPGQDPHSQYAAVIPRFIKRVLNGEPPIIFGDGTQTRDFTFVEDVVEANILAMESNATGVFNIGTGKSISISDLANEIIDITGRSLVPLFQEKRAGDVEHSVADISKASTFGYRPKYSLREGITEILRQTTISADRNPIWK
jgi:UDP-glucose 4-epimerase